MTSGNLSDEPIAHHDDDAAARLGPLVDGLLQHDRPIHIRCDDSVVRSTPARLQVLRRSRGYAPEPLTPAVPNHSVDTRCRRRTEEHGQRGQARLGRAQPPHRRSRAPRHVSLVPAGRRPSAAPLRSRARCCRPRHAPGVSVEQVGRAARRAHPRRAASSRPRRGMHGGARPSRARAGNRLRRPRLRTGWLAVGWRDARRRLRDVASRRPSSSRAHARRGGCDPRALAHGRRVVRGGLDRRGCRSTNHQPRHRRGNGARGDRSRQATGISGHHECRPALRCGRCSAGRTATGQLRGTGRNRIGSVGAHGRPPPRSALRGLHELRRRWPDPRARSRSADRRTAERSRFRCRDRS